MQYLDKLMLVNWLSPLTSDNPKQKRSLLNRCHNNRSTLIEELYTYDHDNEENLHVRSRENPSSG